MKWWWSPLCTRHWNNSSRVEMSLHSDKLSLFLAKQYFLLLLKAASLTEKHKYQLHSLWLDPIGVRTHDLPHSRRGRESLHHWCGYVMTRIVGFKLKRWCCILYFPFIIYPSKFRLTVSDCHNKNKKLSKQSMI